MDKNIRIEIREGGDIAYFFRFSTFFLHARKRMLQQLFWQEFSKTLRLWRRLAGFFMRALMSEVSG